MALAEPGARSSPLAWLRLTDPLVLSAIILAIAPFWQLRFGVNGDASWIITMCERVLAGDRLYVDLIETNPPFTIWMFMPAVLLARMLGVSPEFMMHLYAYVACIGGLAFAGAIVRRANLPERDGLFAILPVMVGLLVLFPGNSFAEREHLGIALLLPLLALMAWRTTDPSARPGLGWSLPAGLFGSVIVLIKPYYVLMILVPAVWSAWRRRSLAGLFEPEYWAAGLACLVYLVAVLTLHPEFMTDVYPLLRDTYMRTSTPLFVLQIYGPTIAIIGYLLYRYRAGGFSPLVAIAILAGAAGLIPLIYQGKGWAYHAYPALFLFLTALAYLFRQASCGAGRSKPGLAEVVLLAVTFVVASVPFQLSTRANAAMIETVRASAPDNPGVALIGAGIEAGHPFTRLVGGHWIGSYCSDWLGGFAAFWKAVDESNGRTDLLARYDQILEDYVAGKTLELKAGNPDILLVQKEDSFWTEPFLKRPEMAGFMDRYDLLAEDVGVWVYRLKPQFRG